MSDNDWLLGLITSARYVIDVLRHVYLYQKDVMFCNDRFMFYTFFRSAPEECLYCKKNELFNNQNQFHEIKKLNDCDSCYENNVSESLWTYSLEC